MIAQGLYESTTASRFAYYYRGSTYLWQDHGGRGDWGWYATTDGVAVTGIKEGRSSLTLWDGIYVRSTPLSFLIITGRDYHKATFCFF